MILDFRNSSFFWRFPSFSPLSFCEEQQLCGDECGASVECYWRG